MNETPLDELNDQEFNCLIEDFLMRPDDPVAPSIFLGVLKEFLQGQATRVVELTAELIGDQLRFDSTASVPVQGNEFFFGDTRFVIKLRQAQTHQGNL